MLRIKKKNHVKYRCIINRRIKDTTLPRYALFSVEFRALRQRLWGKTCEKNRDPNRLIEHHLIIVQLEGIYTYIEGNANMAHGP